MPTSYDLAEFIQSLRKEYVLNFFGEVRSKKNGRILKPHVHACRNIFYLRIRIKGKNLLVHKLNYLWQFEDIIWLRNAIKLLETGENQLDHDDGNTFNNFRMNIKSRPVQENQKKRRPYYKGEK